jgi:hypothetical protein
LHHWLGREKPKMDEGTRSSPSAVAAAEEEEEGGGDNELSEPGAKNKTQGERRRRVAPPSVNISWRPLDTLARVGSMVGDDSGGRKRRNLFLLVRERREAETSAVKRSGAAAFQ